MASIVDYRKGNFYFKLFIMLIVIIIIITSFVVYLYFANSNNYVANSLKINLRLEKDSLYNDEFLKFSTELYSNKKCKGLLLYEIFNLDNLSIIFSRDENIEFIEKIIRINQFSLKNLDDGSYILREIVKCGDVKGVSTAKFNIIPKQILNISHANKTETLQNIAKITSSEVQEAPPVKEKELKISDIIEISKTDAAKAEQLCNSLKTDNDKCLASIAVKTKNKTYCSKVEEVSLRDGCYANLALLGDYNVCGDIYDSYQKQGCYALKSNIVP